MPLRDRDRLEEGVPIVGKDPACTLLVEPVDLFGAAKKYSSQDQRRDPLRVRFRIGQRQCRAPGTAKDQPTIDVQPVADTLDVGDQVPGPVML